MLCQTEQKTNTVILIQSRSLRSRIYSPHPKDMNSIPSEAHPLELKANTLQLTLCGLFLFGCSMNASQLSKEWKFPCSQSEIAHYTAYRIHQPVKVDGLLDEACWKAALRSPRFVDIITGKPTLHDTRAALLWDEEFLYAGYWVEEPDVQATLTERDSLIYQNNDVELFIAGQDGYYELEINALNTIYEVFFIWEDAFEKGRYSAIAEFNRSNPKVRPFNGVEFSAHPRGKRVGSWAWDFPGLKTAVHVDGTLNNRLDKDKGWTVELALPWRGMSLLAKGDSRRIPPGEGDVWRIDFSRFNQYKAPPPAKASGGWVWSRHGAWDSHIPECFPFIRFSSKVSQNGSGVPHSRGAR
jgi:hypothetical protein